MVVPGVAVAVEDNLVRGVGAVFDTVEVFFVLDTTDLPVVSLVLIL